MASKRDEDIDKMGASCSGCCGRLRFRPYLKQRNATAQRQKTVAGMHSVTSAFSVHASSAVAVTVTAHSDARSGKHSNAHSDKHSDARGDKYFKELKQEGTHNIRRMCQDGRQSASQRTCRRPPEAQEQQQEGVQ